MLLLVSIILVLSVKFALVEKFHSIINNIKWSIYLNRYVNKTCIQSVLYHIVLQESPIFNVRGWSGKDNVWFNQ